MRSLKHALEYAVFRVVRGAVVVVPEVAAMAVGSLLGWIAGSVLRIRRGDVDRHLRLAFPERSERWRARVARDSYRHLGREAAATFRAAAWTPEKLIERTRMIGFEEALAATRSGGVLMLTGHLGNWELGGAAVAARGVEMDVVARGMANERFQTDLFRARERMGMRVVDRAAAPREVLRSLRRGRTVAIVGDQDAYRGGIFVPFFGKLASTAKGPALFALRSGAPVFVVTVLREPGRRQYYTISFSRLDLTPSGDLDRDVTTLTAAYTKALEEAVRTTPGQYLWLHRRWKRRPPEEQRGAHEVSTA